MNLLVFMLCLVNWWLYSWQTSLRVLSASDTKSSFLFCQPEHYQIQIKHRGRQQVWTKESLATPSYDTESRAQFTFSQEQHILMPHKHPLVHVGAPVLLFPDMSFHYF